MAYNDDNNISDRIDELKPLLKSVLAILGENPDRDGLHQTPERWARALLDYTQGLHQDPFDHLKINFTLDEDDYPTETHDMIIQSNIEFVSMCEHHLAPFRGFVDLAYIPNNTSRIITGLSKLSRVVNVFARRLQVQERMTQQIARALDEHLKPVGVIVVSKAIHYCMIQRGVEQRDSVTITTAKRGVFITKPDLERKFQDYLRFESRSVFN
jgi:GTP cyclohydrolase I